MWAASAVSDEDRLDRAETGRGLRRSLQFAQPYRRGISLAVALVAVSTVCALTGPVLVKVGLDRGIKDRSTSALDMAVLAYIVVIAIGYVVGRLQYLTINRAGEGFLRDLRVAVFDRLQAQSMAYFDRNKAGVLVSRMTADIERMAGLIRWGPGRARTAYSAAARGATSPGAVACRPGTTTTRTTATTATASAWPSSLCFGGLPFRPCPGAKPWLF